jgi:hypothetical protein
MRRRRRSTRATARFHARSTSLPTRKKEPRLRRHSREDKTAATDRGLGVGRKDSTSDEYTVARIVVCRITWISSHLACSISSTSMWFVRWISNFCISARRNLSWRQSIIIYAVLLSTHIHSTDSTWNLCMNHSCTCCFWSSSCILFETPGADTSLGRRGNHTVLVLLGKR